MANCVNCGNLLRAGARFCARCGAAQTPAPSPTPLSTPAPPSQPLQARSKRGRTSLPDRILLALLGIAGIVLLGGLTVMAWNESQAAAPAAGSASVTDLRPREAGQRGLDWLLSSAVTWQRDNRCYGCHVQSFAVMGAGVGEANDYVVDRAQAAELADYLVSIQAAAGYVTAGRGDAFRPRIQTVLAGIGLSQLDARTRAAYQDALVKMADWLVSEQSSDGHWEIDHVEAPVDQGNAMMTGGALLTLAAAQEYDGKAAYQTAIEQGERWLRSAAVETTQDIVFAIIGLQAAGAENKDEDIQRLLQLLRERQRDDGGWGETASLGSNGYATGQALYAYKLASVPIRDLSFQRGALWLLENQTDKGIWKQVNSQQRSSGRSSDFATTMWAAIGLGQVFDVQTEAEFITLIHPERAALTLPALCLFYLLPLLLLAPVLWRRQGRYWLAGRREGRREEGGR